MTVSRALVSMPVDRRLTTPRSALDGGRRRILMESAIDTGGVVVQVTVLRGTSRPGIDDAIVEDLRMHRVFPATIDGVAIPSWARTDGTTMKR